MPMIDAFKSDIFRFADLMGLVGRAPYQPGQLTSSGMWTGGEGLTTTTAIIDMQSDGALNLIDVSPRTGAPENQRHLEKGSSVPVMVPHMEDFANVAADVVLGARKIGTKDGKQLLSSKVTSLMTAIKNDFVYTSEYHKRLNLDGNFMDVNGNIFSAYTLFGLTAPPVVNWDLSNATNTQIRTLSFQVIKGMKDAMGGVPFRGIKWWHGDDEWEGMLDNQSIEKTFLNQQEAQQRRGDVIEDAVTINGITHEWYRGDTQIFIPPKEGRIVPMGVNDFFMTRHSPAPFIETIDRPGVRFNAKVKNMDWDEGVKMKVTSDEINIPTRPEAIFSSITP
jgi:hypothetical protein